MVQAISPILKANLLMLARAYCAATGVNMDTVSRYATNDSRTLGRLEVEDGASITLRKYDDSIAWFFANWPKGAKRPSIKNPSHWRPRASRHPRVA
jgi:hypothetical protein